MLELILFFLIISSGSVLCSAVWGKKYEEVLPISCSAIVLILFIFGICNLLEIGSYVVGGLSVCCYLIAGVWAIKHKKVKAWLSNIFTLSFGVFVFMIAGVTFAIYGKVLHSWDEFSHWGTIVKSMVNDDALSTCLSAENYTMFAAYPPGMSLFQYMFQKIHIWISDNSFCEWMLYAAYQLFAFAFLMPFIKGKVKSHLGIAVTTGVLFFLGPIIFYNEVYSTLYIDPILGILSGVGIATVLWNKKRDIWYSLQIWMICSMLVLVKDAGMLFAVILGMLYLADIVLEDKIFNKNKVWNIIVTIISIALPKGLWSLSIRANDISQAFSTPIDFKQFINIILHKDYSYRRTVLELYCEAFFKNQFEIGNMGIRISYFVILLVLIFLLVLLLKKGCGGVNLTSGKCLLVIVSIIIQSLIYVLGLGLTYTFKFSEYEGMRLASYERYMNILMLSISIVVLVSIVNLLYSMKSGIYAFGIVVLIIMISPMQMVYNHIFRGSVYLSKQVRLPYEQTVSMIDNRTDNSDRIYLIAQESNGFDLIVFRHLLRPQQMNGTGYSIGENFYEGDIWTVPKTKEVWMEELCANYDYVVLYCINDYFVDNYGSLFADEVIENGIYYIDKENQKLELQN